MTIIRCRNPKCRRKVSILAVAMTDSYCMPCFQQRVRDRVTELWEKK